MTSQCAMLTSGRPRKWVCPKVSSTTRHRRRPGWLVREPFGSGWPWRTKLTRRHAPRANIAQAGRDSTNPMTPKAMVVVVMPEAHTFHTLATCYRQTPVLFTLNQGSDTA